MRFSLALFLAVCLSLFASSPEARPLPCAPRAKVLEMLAKSEQTRRASGQTGRAVMETFANAHTGAWTITVSLPDGRMCLLANGQSFALRDDPFPALGRAI